MTAHSHSHDHNHSHNHGHGGHSHHGDIRSFTAAFAISVTLTFAYTFTEAGYALYAHSMGLLADALHNFGDGLGLILAWVANWLLSFPARKRYSYGFKRTTVIAALANAVLLIATSAIIAYESIYKLMHLTAINENIVMIVAAIGILVNGGTSLLFMRGAQDDINIKGAFLHLMADALILVGVVFSAILIKFTHLLWIDPIVGLIIVCIVLWGTWGLLRDSVSLILDAIPRYIDHIGVEQYLKQYKGVTAVHDLHIWGLSTREVALTAHLVVPEIRLTDADYEKINIHLRDHFKINHATIQVETGQDESACRRSETC